MTDSRFLGFDTVTSFFDGLFDSGDAIFKEAAESIFTNPLDVVYTEDEAVATLDVPGVKTEDITVKVVERAPGFSLLTVTTNRDGVEKIYTEALDRSVVGKGAKATVELGVLTVKVALDKATSFDVPVA